MSHLLPLSTLHTAAPGVLDVVFGADGDFKGAPQWTGPLTSIADPWRHGWAVWRGLLRVSIATHDGFWSYGVEDWRVRWALDCRIPSVAARLLRLCSRASDTAETIDGADDLLGGFSAYMIGMVPWSGEHASRLASLTLSLAPKIAALRSPA